MQQSLPLDQKYMLTLKEATAYFGIGEKKMAILAEENVGLQMLKYIEYRDCAGVFCGLSSAGVYCESRHNHLDFCTYEFPDIRRTFVLKPANP